MDWQRAYADRETPWDLGQITPPLLRLLASGRLAALGLEKGARVAVPGCGRGHDLRALARHGFSVTGFDLVPGAVAEARALLAWNRCTRRARVLCRDVLGIAAEFPGAFDLVYDYTCLCALKPHLRERYAREMAAVLRARGFWLNLTFPTGGPLARGPDDGPPYRLTADDVAGALGPHFERVAGFPAEDSVPERRGHEQWELWRKR